MIRRTPQGHSIQNLNNFGDLGALLPLADTHLDVSTLGHVAVPCFLQLTDVYERVGPPYHGDKAKALFSIEPFDDCFDGF